MNNTAKQPPSIAVWLALVGAGLVVLIGVARSLVETRYIPSGAMAPTLTPGDRVVIDKLSYRLQDPQRADIVLFYPPEAAQQMAALGNTPLVMRVIGLPGETVEVREGSVWINGTRLDEPYTTDPPNYTWGPVTLPADAYVVLGDNRNNSFDSHIWGYVPRDAIFGRSLLIF